MSLTNIVITKNVKNYAVHDRARIWQIRVLPLLFLIYINDLLDTCGSYSKVYAFADDAKFFRHILTDDDSNDLQCAVDALQNWSRKWLLNLNVNKNSSGDEIANVLVNDDIAHT